jgi:hypothetical protein
MTSGNFNTAVGYGTLATVNGGQYQNTALGAQALTKATGGSENTALGSYSLYNNLTGSNLTAVGNQAGYTSASGSGSVFLGNYAGFYETASNKLFIDNTLRASEADGRAKALVYGIFDAATANQYLTVNGHLNTIQGSMVDGSSDEVQLTLQGNATQTTPILTVETSAGADKFTVDNAGAVVASSSVTCANVTQTGGYFNITAGGMVWDAGSSTQYIKWFGSSGYATRIRQNGDAVVEVDNASDGGAASVQSAKWKMTPEGGQAIKVVAGENLALGEVVYIKQASGADGKVWKAPIDSDMPVGVVYAAANADADVWVVVSGIVSVLPTSGVTAARGEIIYCSGTTAGRVDQSTTLPAVAPHNREVGHWLDTGSGNGAATRAIVHFN